MSIPPPFYSEGEDFRGVGGLVHSQSELGVRKDRKQKEINNV